MDCTQTKRQLRFGYPAAPELRATVEAHAEGCHMCRERVAVARVTSSLVKSFAIPPASEDAGGTLYSEQRLVSRTMIRIRELKERGATSWTAAVINLRSWLFAFGAVALMLLALSAWEVVAGNWREEAAFDLTLAPGAPSPFDEESDHVQR